MITTDEQAWETCSLKDKWVFNKLEVAMRTGLKCGLREIPVFMKGQYIIRPVYNLNGLSRGTKDRYLTPKTTEFNVPLGHFWSEKLQGEHLSVDYVFGTPVLTVVGKKFKNSLSLFDSWTKISSEKAPHLPDFLYDLTTRHSVINVEFINNIPIEVHLRPNPDFTNHNYNKLITVFSPLEADLSNPDFIEDKATVHGQDGQKFTRYGFIGSDE